MNCSVTSGSAVMGRLGFVLAAALAASVAAQDQYVYINNGVIRAGIDVSRGGSLGFLADAAGRVGMAKRNRSFVLLVELFFFNCASPLSLGHVAVLPDPNYNVINCHDMGREVQLSFYSGPVPYDPAQCPQWMGSNWPWNPIGAGDVFGNHGDILDLTSTATSVHLVTRPLQWACKDVACKRTGVERGVR